MYIGTNSIAKLAAFLRGYQYALEQHSLGQDDNFLAALQEMAQSRFGVKISKAWEEILLFHSSDDNEAMDFFWRLYDDYRSRRENGDSDHRLSSEDRSRQPSLCMTPPPPNGPPAPPHNLPPP